MPPATIGSPNRLNSRHLPLANRTISRHTGNMRNLRPPTWLSTPAAWPSRRPAPSVVTAMTATRSPSGPVTLVTLVTEVTVTPSPARPVTLVTLVTAMQRPPAAVSPVTLRGRVAAEPRPATIATPLQTPATPATSAPSATSATTLPAPVTTIQPPMKLPTPRRGSVYGWPVGYQPAKPGSSRPPIPGIKMSRRRLRPGVDWRHARPHA